MATSVKNLSYGAVEIYIEESDTLGVGSYGKVCKAKCGQLPCAAKLLHDTMFGTNDPGVSKFVEQFEQECQFLRAIKHPNIVQFLGTSRDPQSRRLALLMELMDESLTRFLERSTVSLPYHIQLNICRDVALALAYLHSNEIIHRDLSSNNVLLIGEGIRAKVTDFGMSKLEGMNPRMTPLTMCPGTSAYMPPEALIKHPRYISKLDCFSHGVLIVQIATRQFPNPGDFTTVVDDARSPTGKIEIPIAEYERRKKDIDLVAPDHPLLPLALHCLKDRDTERPSADELCERLATLKESKTSGRQGIDGASGNEVRKEQDEMKKLESAKTMLENEVDALKQTIKANTITHQALMDEYQALQASSDANEAKVTVLEKENDRLRTQLIQIKSQQADDLNAANESIQRNHEKKLIGNKPKPSICPTAAFYTFDAHDSEVSALCYSDDGNYMATGGADKLVKVWVWRPFQKKMELRYTLRGCQQSIMSIQFDQNCQQVLAAASDGTARIWTFHEERPKHTLTGHANKVMAAKFLEDNTKVVTGSHDLTLKLWDLQQKDCIRTLFAGSSCNDVVAGHGLGPTVISGHFDRRIQFWDTRTATANKIALPGKVTSLDHFADRHLLLCCSRDDSLRLIDLRQNSIVTTYNADGFRVSMDWTKACFSPDGQYVAAGSSDGSLFVWDTISNKCKREKCKEHSKEIVVCRWHPRGQQFATADRNKKVAIWKR